MLMEELFEMKGIGSTLFEASEKESEWLDLSSTDILKGHPLVGDLENLLSAKSALNLVVKASSVENCKRLFRDSTYLLSIYGDYYAYCPGLNRHVKVIFNLV